MNYFLPFLVTIVTTLIVMRSKLAHKNAKVVAKRNVQNMHQDLVSRLGGIGIICGAITSMLVAQREDFFLFFSIILSATPIVLGGFMDDLTQKISPIIRLTLGFVSGAIFIAMTGYVVTNIDMPYVRIIFQLYPTAFIITALALAGVAHGMNIIDGFNGLSTGAATVMFLSLAILARKASDMQISHIAFAHAAIAFGFFVINFPKGPIFVGDGGVYYLGFSLAAIVIMLIVRNPSLSPWVITLTIIYPIVEALFSIFRKLSTRGHHPFIPDNFHIHQLVYRIAVKNRLGIFKRRHINAVTGILMICFTIFCALISHIGYGNTHLAILLFLGVVLVYLISYALFAQIAFKREK